MAETTSSFYDDEDEDEDEDEEVYRYGLGAAGDVTVRAKVTTYSTHNSRVLTKTYLAPKGFRV